MKITKKQINKNTTVCKSSGFNPNYSFLYFFYPEKESVLSEKITFSREFDGICTVQNPKSDSIEEIRLSNDMTKKEFVNEVYEYLNK